MMKSEWIIYPGLFFAGVVIGKLYCTLLWHQIQKIVKKKGSIPGVVGGFFFRLGFLGGSFYLLLQYWRIEGLLIFLAGFFIAKMRSKKEMVKGRVRG